MTLQQQRLKTLVEKLQHISGKRVVLTNVVSQLDQVDSDHQTNLYLEGKASEREWIQYIKQEVLTEGIIDTIKSKLLSILKSIFDGLLRASKRVLAALKVVYSLVAKFAQQYPLLFKVIIITLVFLLVMSVTAMAATGNTEYSTGLLNASMGLIDSMSSSVLDHASTTNIMEAKAYLVMLRDNHTDITPDILEKSKVIAQAAIHTVQGYLQDAEKTTDANVQEQIARSVLSWMEQGEKLVSAKITTMTGDGFSSSNIKLGYK